MTVHGCRIVASICHAIVLSIFVIGPITAWAYEEAAVSNGGTVTGTVQFSGEPPPPTPFELRRYPDQVYCGALSDGSGYRLLREVAVGAQQGLKDVIVTIESIEKGKPFELTETNTGGEYLSVRAVRIGHAGTSPIDSEKSRPRIP